MNMVQIAGRDVAEVVAVPAGSNACNSAYNSLWQVRTDARSTLEESTAQLALHGARQHPVEQVAGTVAEALDVLAPIERFWALPGMQAFYRARRLFDPPLPPGLAA